MKVIIVAVFLLLGVTSIQSDHIEDDCREIHCPQPELNCPIDSELKSSADDTDDEDEDGNSNPFDRLADEGLIDSFFPDSLLPMAPPPAHVVEKRSLQHRRREAIKIVPGDYRSFEPEFFTYHNHHQPHRKWKRDLIMGVQPHSEAEIKKCCPDFQCVCKTCPGAPKCNKGEVGILLEEGNGLPGNCCSKYVCIPEIECIASNMLKLSYWRDECTKCDCIEGQELCQQLCETKVDDSAKNCFSVYLNRPMMNGDSWLEDQDCKECKCINGDNHCEESFCKPVECSNPIKIEGRCCKVCPSTTASTSTSSTPLDITSTTDMPAIDVTTMTDLSTESPATARSAPSSAKSSTTSEPIIVTDSEEDATTYTSPTVIITATNGFWKILKQYVIYVICAVLALVIVCALVIGSRYMVGQNRKKKNSMYSTIPSSESSQSSSVTLA